MKLEDHPNGFHESDNIVTETIERNGTKHEVTHCKYCGIKLTKPIKSND